MPSLAVLAFVALLLVLMLTPIAFPRSPGDAAGRVDAEARGVPVIYWRSGCTFCLRLRAMLGAHGGRAVWVNIRSDPAAAARVRSVNGGNETVPTVFVGTEHRTNPAPAWVREQIKRAPVR